MNKNNTRQQILTALAAAHDKKAEDVSILEMDQSGSSFTDYFIICSGSNPRQIQAISDEVEQRLAKAGLRPTHVEGYQKAEWVLLDYLDFVVHVFSPAARNFYDLERLWKSAKRLTAAELAKAPARKAAGRAAKAASKKKAAAAKPRSAARGRAAKPKKRTRRAS